MSRIVNVAIDGPAGAGKSTLARRAAQKLGYLYIDTGAMYRTVALRVLRAEARPDEPEQVIPLLQGLEIQMDYSPEGEQRMYLNGEDVSEAIRVNSVSEAASKVSAIPEVRAFLLEHQRKLARERSVIMDGRDIGTVILPDAQVKIFLTAAPEARAKRRVRDLELRGQTADYETILQEILQRDDRDRNRSVAPLRQAEDAVLLDTTQLNLEQSLSALLTLIEGTGKT